MPQGPGSWPLSSRRSLRLGACWCANREWLALLEQVHGKRGEPITRYAIRKEPQAFDRARLRAFRDSLPKGYSLRLIDRELYGRVLQTPWARDFCAQFGSWEEYAAHGCGFVAIKDGQVAAGACLLHLVPGRHRD